MIFTKHTHVLPTILILILSAFLPSAFADSTNKAEDMQKACDGGSMTACLSLGDLYRNGEGAKKDYQKAIKLYRKACDGGVMDACSNLGRAYHNSEGVKQNHDKAKPLYQKACDGGFMKACSNLGILYFYGRGVKQDYDLAMKLYQKACDGEVMRACGNLGSLYHIGKDVKQDYEKANKLSQKACDGGFLGACFNLGRAYYIGAGVKQDYDKAILLYQKACEGDDMNACYVSAGMYYTGEDVKQDYDKAILLYQKACEGDEMNACYILALMFYSGEGVEQNYNKANQLYQKACDGDEMTACLNLGKLYHTGKRVEQNYKRANQLYQKACDADEMTACYNLGVLYYNGQGVEQNYNKASRLFEQACNGGHIDACHNSAVMYYHGQGVEQNFNKASRLFEQACDNRNQKACFGLGEQYVNGYGVKQNISKAKQLFKLACEIGSEKACDSLKQFKLDDLDVAENDSPEQSTNPLNTSTPASTLSSSTDPAETVLIHKKWETFCLNDPFTEVSQCMLLSDQIGGVGRRLSLQREDDDEFVLYILDESVGEGLDSEQLTDVMIKIDSNRVLKTTGIARQRNPAIIELAIKLDDISSVISQMKKGNFMSTKVRFEGLNREYVDTFSLAGFTRNLKEAMLRDERRPKVKRRNSPPSTVDSFKEILAAIKHSIVSRNRSERDVAVQTLLKLRSKIEEPLLVMVSEIIKEVMEESGDGVILDVKNGLLMRHTVSEDFRKNKNAKFVKSVRDGMQHDFTGKVCSQPLFAIYLVYGNTISRSFRLEGGAKLIENVVRWKDCEAR